MVSLGSQCTTPGSKWSSLGDLSLGCPVLVSQALGLSLEVHVVTMGSMAGPTLGTGQLNSSIHGNDSLCPDTFAGGKPTCRTVRQGDSQLRIHKTS